MKWFRRREMTKGELLAELIYLAQRANASLEPQMAPTAKALWIIIGALIDDEVHKLVITKDE